MTTTTKNAQVSANNTVTTSANTKIDFSPIGENVKANIDFSPIGENAKANLPIGENYSVTIGGVTLEAQTMGALSSKAITLAVGAERLSFPVLAAISIIGGLPESLKLKTPRFIKALGSPVDANGDPITYATPKIGSYLVKACKFTELFRGITNPWLLLKGVTDINEGAERLAAALESEGVIFNTFLKEFVEDPESPVTKERKAAEMAAMESEKAAADTVGTDTEGSGTDTSAPLEEALLETVTQAESLIDEIIGMLAGRYVMTSEKALPFKELKAVTIENDKAIAEIIAMLAAKKAA